jgi:hypothetical protein
VNNKKTHWRNQVNIRLFFLSLIIENYGLLLGPDVPETLDIMLNTHLMFRVGTKFTSTRSEKRLLIIRNLQSEKTIVNKQAEFY